MNRSAVVLGAGLLALLGGWIVQRRGYLPRALAPLQGLHGEGRVPGARLPREASQGATREPLAELEAGPVERVLAAEAAGADLPRFRLFGRVVDERGVALSGVELRIESESDSWARTHQAESSVGPGWYEPRSDGSRSARLATAQDGSFELRGVIPTDYYLELEFLGSRYHSRVVREFCSEEDFDERLLEGDNDLGALTLLPAGALEGVLLNSAGEPLVGARVAVDEDLWGIWVPGGVSDAAGRFHIPHLLPASYELLVEARGHLDARRDGVAVRAGATTTGVDFVLEAAPTLAGTVLDRAGRPVVRATVSGFPLANGEADVSCLTDRQGNFLLELEWRGPYALGVRREELALGAGKRLMVDHFEPGSAGIEVVLPVLEELRLEVVDARSGEPVELFGLRLEACQPLDDGGHEWRRNTRWWIGEEIPRSHSKAGRVDLRVEPGTHAYAIEAAGYAPQREPLQRAPAGARQRIRLEPEARLGGWLELEGEPVAAAAVTLRRASFARGTGRALRGVDASDERRVYDLDAFTGRPRTVRSDGRGRFELGELAAGCYSLELKSSRSSLLVLGELRLESGEELELGRLRLSLGSVLHGTLQVAPGVSAGELQVSIESGEDEQPGYAEQRVPVRPDGSFEVVGLSAGRYSLVVDDLPGIVRDMPPVELEIRAGRDAELQLDVRPWQPSRLHVRATRAGRPVAGARVLLRRSVQRVPRPVGRTDRHGELEVFCTPGQNLSLELLGERDLPLAEGAMRFDLLPGASREVVLEVRSGTLVVRFPEDFEFPARGRVWPGLRVTASAQGGRRFGVQPDPLDRLEGRREWDLGAIAAGDYELRFEVRAPILDAGGLVGPETHAILVGSARVRAEERVVCRLSVAGD